MKNMELSIEPHLLPSKLILYKGLDKTTKLYRFVGDIESAEFDAVKDYFYYITPEFALNNRLLGFDSYKDIGYYCEEKDVWCVEDQMDVALELTIGFEKQTLIDEKDRRQRAYLKFLRKQKESLALIDKGFTDATYPDRRHDHLFDIVHSSRVYVPRGRRFFSKHGVMFLIRETGDYIARLTNSEYDDDLCNTTGLVRGIYCYTEYKTNLARLINENCDDKTEEFRRLYSKRHGFHDFKDKPPKHKKHKHIGCKFDKWGGLY